MFKGEKHNRKQGIEWKMKNCKEKYKWIWKTNEKTLKKSPLTKNIKSRVLTPKAA
jgi:hypothetical protein